MCSWNDVLDNLVNGWLRDHPGAGHKNPPLKKTRQPKQHLWQCGLQSICILASDAFLWPLYQPRTPDNSKPGMILSELSLIRIYQA